MGKRKEPIYRFSGAPSYDTAALRDALAGATTVQFSQGGYLIYAIDREADVLADETEKYVAVQRRDGGPRITEEKAIAELLDALDVSEVTDMLCMCTGDFAAEFYDDHRNLLGVVRIDIPDRIEWPHWPGIARLSDPRRLERWMTEHWASSTGQDGSPSPADPLPPISSTWRRPTTSPPTVPTSQSSWSGMRWACRRTGPNSPCHGWRQPRSRQRR